MARTMTPHRIIRRLWTLGFLVAVAACANNTSPPLPPDDFEIASTRTSTDRPDQELYATLRDSTGQEWNLTTTRTDNSVRVVLESADHTIAYAQTMSTAGTSAQSLDAAGEHWKEGEVLSKWSSSLTTATQKLGQYLAARSQPEVGYTGWCDGACDVACTVAANWAGAILGLSVCEGLIGWTGWGATICVFTFGVAMNLGMEGCQAACMDHFGWLCEPKCSPDWSGCSKNSDCCDDNCNPYTFICGDTYQCSQEWWGCSSDFDCCPGLVCDNGTYLCQPFSTPG